MHSARRSRFRPLATSRCGSACKPDSRVSKRKGHALHSRLEPAAATQSEFVSGQFAFVSGQWSVVRCRILRTLAYRPGVPCRTATGSSGRTSTRFATCRTSRRPATPRTLSRLAAKKRPNNLDAVQIRDRVNGSRAINRWLQRDYGAGRIRNHLGANGYLQTAIARDALPCN
jgi:hypothetical protein